MDCKDRYDACENSTYYAKIACIQSHIKSLSVAINKWLIKKEHWYHRCITQLILCFFTAWYIAITTTTINNKAIWILVSIIKDKPGPILAPPSSMYQSTYIHPNKLYTAMINPFIQQSFQMSGLLENQASNMQIIIMIIGTMSTILQASYNKKGIVLKPCLF